MATTQENKNKHSPNDCKKKKNYKNKYQQIHSNKWENDKRTGRLKKELNRTGIDNEGSLEWLRRG